MSFPMSALGLAAWFGLLTAISPCPMATNIAAVSYIGKKVESPFKVLLSGLLYTLGRVFAYVALAALIVGALLSQSAVSSFMTGYLTKVMGPLLIVVGVFLLGLVELSFSIGVGGEGVQKKVDSMGMTGSFLLGILFALAFCPTSAVLYFGSLLPLCVEHSSSVMLPLVYGVTTGLPVLLFAFLLAFAAARVGAAYNKLTVFSKWARIATGVIFIVVGVYYTLFAIYGVNIL